MLGPALISAVLGLLSEPPQMMSLPLEDIFCFDREPPRPIRTRACVELDGVPGMECWPDLPASVPEVSPLWSVRAFTAGSNDLPLPPRFSELALPEHEVRAADGHRRAPDEPPRA